MKKSVITILSAIGIFLLIIDSRTAISGCKEGINLCMQAVIPSLLPFFVLSGFLCSNLTGVSVPILQPIGRLCAIPKGGESLLLLGLLGGYPVGAQNIHDAVASGALDKQTAKRMLVFCNNAGPAFIFGMSSSLFSRNIIPWALWLVHIASALIVGIVLPGRSKESCSLTQRTSRSFMKIVEKSAKTMAIVCCWVILFRVVINFCKHWFFWLLPVEVQVLFTGVAELSNGVIDLMNISNLGLRFILCSVMLSLGGVCVTMQTLSITGNIEMDYYFPGKLLQVCFSFILSSLIQMILFSQAEIYKVPFYAIAGFIAVSLSIILILHRNKNNSRIVAPGLI